MYTNRTSSNSNNLYAALLQQRLNWAPNAAVSPNLLGAASTSSNAASGKALLQTATNSLFAMADLSKRVRDLSARANALRPLDTAGLESVRTQMTSMLSEFDKIGTSGAKQTSVKPPAAHSATTSLNKPSLSEVRSTLADMSDNLRENMAKLGKASITAGSSTFTYRL